MKKTIYIFIAFIMFSSIFSSCSVEEPDLFNMPAYERMEKRAQDYRTLLSEGNGTWFMKYYPGGANQIYGGFAFVVRFTKEGDCYFQSIFSEDLATMEKSQYSIKKDYGVTLNFDTYNEAFHQFSSADVVVNSLHGGYLGDYEFILGEIAADKSFEMIGKKHKSVIKMLPFKGDAIEFLSNVKKNRDDYSSTPGIESVSGKLGDYNVNGEILNTQLLNLSIGDSVTFQIPFMFTDKGVEIYDEIKVKDIVIKDLNLNLSDYTIKSSDNVLNLNLNRNPKALKIDEYLGKYNFVYTFSKKQKTVPVEILKIDDQSLVLKGLPFDLNLRYNFQKGIIELNPFYIDFSKGYVVAMLAFNVGGYLNYSNSDNVGMYADWNGDKENMEFTFVDNGRSNWFVKDKKALCNAIIIWDSKQRKQYTGFGDSWLADIKLIKVK